MNKVLKYLKFTSPAHTSMAVPYTYTHMGWIIRTFMDKYVHVGITVATSFSWSNQLATVISKAIVQFYLKVFQTLLSTVIYQYICTWKWYVGLVMCTHITPIRMPSWSGLWIVNGLQLYIRYTTCSYNYIISKSISDYV